MAAQTASLHFYNQRAGKARRLRPPFRALWSLLPRWIREAKGLLYGGYALHIPLRKAHDPLYTDEDWPDIDVLVADAIRVVTTWTERIQRLDHVERVEVRPALHVGTLKLYVNFEPIVDLTEIAAESFAVLWHQRWHIGGWNIVPRAYLLRNLHMELATPDGNRERLGKILARLTRLQHAYPPDASPSPSASKPTESDAVEPAPRASWWKEVNACVVWGGRATSFARSVFGDSWADVLHDNVLEWSAAFQQAHPEWTLTTYDALPDLRPTLVDARSETHRFTVMQTEACWQMVSARAGRHARVASFDTVHLLLCMWELDVATLGKLGGSLSALRAFRAALTLERTFRLSCVGHTHTRASLVREREWLQKHGHPATRRAVIGKYKYKFVRNS